jgi:hypothetical protein
MATIELTILLVPEIENSDAFQGLGCRFPITYFTFGKTASKGTVDDVPAGKNRFEASFDDPYIYI